jgi:hypothetical protein
MREWIKQFSAMERPARGLFLRACVLLPLISASLRLRGFRKTKALLQLFLSAPYGSQNLGAQACAALTAQVVRAAVRSGIGDSNCLKVSLALWWLLARQGIASDLRVGVHTDGGKFEAHAWVECGRVAFNDPEKNYPDYAVFDTALASLPPERR